MGSIMRIITRASFGAAMFLTLAYAVPVSAADGWYVSGNVGLSSLADSDVTDEVIGTGTGKGEVSFDNGHGLTASIGRSWGAMRFEGEISYRKNDLNDITVTEIQAGGLSLTGSATATLGGNISSLGFMANGFYDFDTQSNWVPFLTAGIGATKLSLDVTSVAGTATTYDESDTVLAYQAGAGVGYKLSAETSANLQYRLFGTSDPTFSDGVDKVDAEYISHNIMIGITHRF